MSEQVYWLLETHIVPGKLEELRTLVNELVAATREESGVIDYLYHLSPDSTTLHIFERFKDSAATLVHMQTFAKFAARFAALEHDTTISVYGRPNDEVKAAIAGLSPVYYTSLAGFSR